MDDTAVRPGTSGTGMTAGEATALAERFVRDGFVKMEGAFPARVAADAQRLLWAETGCDPDDPGTWDRPVQRAIRAGLAAGAR